MPSTIKVMTSAHMGVVREKLTLRPTPSSQKAKPSHNTGPHLLQPSASLRDISNFMSIPRKLRHQRPRDSARNSESHKQRQQKCGCLQWRVPADILEIQRQEIQVDLPDEIVTWRLEKQYQSRSVSEQSQRDDRDPGEALLNEEEEKPADRTNTEHRDHHGAVPRPH